jgi:hypothetical protein
MANELTREEESLVERVQENCDLLTKGWRERVEYTEPVKYHDQGCAFSGTPAPCECRVENEKRVRHVQQQGLLNQLRLYTKSKDTDRNPKSARAAPRVKTPKMHPELNGFFTLDEITCDAYMVIDRVMDEGGRDRNLVSNELTFVLSRLPYQMHEIVRDHPDLVRDMMKATDRWVAKARATLNLTVSDAMFADTVCGNCGGGLAVAWDGSSDVRCVGSPSEPPCGETYPMSEWVALYEKGRKGAQSAGQP